MCVRERRKMTVRPAGDRDHERTTRVKESREPEGDEAMSKPERCHWTYDDTHDAWDTKCGEKYQFNDGGPHENGFRFCHHCGRKLTAKKPAADVADVFLGLRD
jgi:hypothetical protein